jgi:excisionase family DNA binding protein
VINLYSFNINIQISDTELKNIISDISNSINIPPIKIISPSINSVDLNNDELLYTVPEISNLLKTDEPTVRELIKRNILVALKLGRLKVTRSELLRFLNDYTGKDLSDLDNIKDL